MIKVPDCSKRAWRENKFTFIPPCAQQRYSQAHGGDQPPLPPLWNSFIGTGINNGPVRFAYVKIQTEKNIGTSFTFFELAHTHTHACTYVKVYVRWSFMCYLTVDHFIRFRIESSLQEACLTLFSNISKFWNSQTQEYSNIFCIS